MTPRGVELRRRHAALGARTARTIVRHRAAASDTRHDDRPVVTYVVETGAVVVRFYLRLDHEGNVDVDAVDWLDRRVFARDIGLIGSVLAVYDDANTGRSAWIEVGMGAFSLRSAVVPLAGAMLWGSDVVVAH